MIKNFTMPVFQKRNLKKLRPHQQYKTCIQQKNLKFILHCKKKWQANKPGVSQLTYKDLLKLLHEGGTSNINLNQMNLTKKKVLFTILYTEHIYQTPGILIITIIHVNSKNIQKFIEIALLTIASIIRIWMMNQIRLN